MKKFNKKSNNSHQLWENAVSSGGELFSAQTLFLESKSGAEAHLQEIPSEHGIFRGFVRPTPPDYVLYFFENSQNLFFVDVGANDGVSWSNSAALERYLGWDGICIEPNPNTHEHLKSVRKCLCLNKCISSAEKELIFRNITGSWHGSSGLLDFFEQDTIDEIEKEVASGNSTYQDIKLTTSTLSSVLKQNKVEHINYLSIDCEGADFEVLQSLDFNEHQPDLISIEFNHKKGRDCDKKATNILESAGYQAIEQVCGDRFFAKQ